MSVHGHCDPAFERVREQFERNFAERGELGAAVSVMVDGVPVVDLWGGVADAASGRPWEQDTVVVVFSTTKGMTSLAAHIMADRGLLDFDAPVARYWPEFAKEGKDDLPVRMLLNHQAGLAAWREPLPDNALYDWELATSRLAEQAPFWEPGTGVGYHGVTFGFLVGEVVRRVSGRSLGAVVQDEIAGPLGLDLWVGLPEQAEPRVATSILAAPTGEETAYTRYVTAYPESAAALLAMNTGGWLGNQERLDTRASHAAEIPAANGITNARSLARMYAPLALDGSFDGVRLVRPEQLAPMRYLSSRTDVDLTARVSTSFSLGFMKSWSNRHAGDGLSIILGEDAFGHAGLGGSVGFADPAHRLSVGYVMNVHGPGTGINRRGQSLVDEVYRILGSPTDAPGFWVRPAS